MKRNQILAIATFAVLFTGASLASAAMISAKTVSSWPDAMVYTSSTPLPAGTVVSDGGVTSFPAFTADTLLIWVDPHPEMKFTHETYYIFISADGSITIEDGDWWPEIGGVPYMYGDKPWLMDFVVDLHDPSSFDAAPDVQVYANPFLLTPSDDLNDGNYSLNDIAIKDYSLFFWIDLDPSAKFAHPTAYLLIPAEGKPSVEHGQWFPYLFDEIILYGEPDTTLRFPYPVNN